MNFLAHTYLSGSDPEILVGNFIGDFVKGKQIEKFEENIQNGIRLHREIDLFTDTHKIHLKSRSRLKATYRHYSGVIVDMYYDHFLAANWSNYSTMDLLVYTLDVYKILNNHHHILPGRAQEMLKYMIPANWLYYYSKIEGIHRALEGMSRRTKFESGMENASEDLRKHYEEFQNEFELFFPGLISFTQTFDFIKYMH